MPRSSITAADVIYPRTITWTKTSDFFGQSWIGEFQTPKGRWFKIGISNFRKKPEVWGFEFSEISQVALYVTDRISKDDLSVENGHLPIGTRLPTGRGEACAVFATVMAGLREFIDAERPEQVKFKGALPRQTELYRSMMRRHKADITAAGYQAKGALLLRL